MIIIQTWLTIQLARRVANRKKKLRDGTAFKDTGDKEKYPVILLNLNHDERRTFAHKRANHWLQEEL